MRIGCWASLALAMLLPLLAPAGAVLAEADRSIADPASPPDAPAMASIRQEIARRASGIDRDLPEAAWLSELAGLYAAPSATPFWTGAGGLNARGEAVAAEIRNADQFGLDAGEYELPGLQDSVAEAEVKLSVAVTRYAWHAHGGRIDPSQLSLWLDQTPRTIYASTVVPRIAAADDVAAALRAEHPRHPQFEALRQALLRARGNIEDPKPAPLQPGARILPGQRHIDVALVRRHLDIPAEEPRETLADDELIEAVRQFMRAAGYGKKKRFIDDEVRAAINAASQRAKPRDNRELIGKILINMERWRWLPHDMGALHVWNNIPEFESRVVKDGQIVHRERIIVGQPHTQTPVFSDAMSQVVFQPTWGLPPSIKLRQFGGRGDISGALARRNMKIVDDNGNVIRPSRIRWGSVDIRNVPIVQGPGPGNPLGRLKFVFPNAHDVYMHDTPDKHLFEARERTFSHGCMRLRNPERYAEVILGLTKGWTAVDVAARLAIDDTQKISLTEHIPVHVTYFTAVVDDRGALRMLKDVYGHDRRIAEAFAGVPYATIAARDPALAQLRENQELARRSGARVSKRNQRYAMGEYDRSRQRPRSGAQAKPKPFSFFSAQGGG